MCGWDSVIYSVIAWSCFRKQCNFLKIDISSTLVSYKVLMPSSRCKVLIYRLHVTAGICSDWQEGTSSTPGAYRVHCCPLLNGLMFSYINLFTNFIDTIRLHEKSVCMCQLYSLRCNYVIHVLVQYNTQKCSISGSHCLSVQDREYEW